MKSGTRRTPRNRGKSAGGPPCPSCGAATVPEARFCHSCGAALQDAQGADGWSVRTIAPYAGVAGLIAAAIVAVLVFSDREPDLLSLPTLPPSTDNSQPTAGSGQPPDLSTMTPREAADRLFNRIMMASEQGNRAEALRFVPMAVQAYARLPALDRDAHYHLGLIRGVAGEEAEVQRQIAALRDGAPNHLLALMLEHDAAKRIGDEAAAARSRAAFTAAYDSEIAAGRPEYEAHRNTIERFRAGAAPFPPAPAPSSAQQGGAALFVAKCGMCHGADGLGTDKGPPLVNKIYEPGHHDDNAFRRAVREGAQAHHWSFGDMPPVPDVSDTELNQIIAYVRGLQVAAGIQ